MGLPSHNAAKQDSAGVYVRHRPETTLLYQVIQEYWPEFQAELASHGKYLPAYVSHIRTTGFYFQTGFIGAQTACKPHSLSWCFCTQQ